MKKIMRVFPIPIIIYSLMSAPIAGVALVLYPMMKPSILTPTVVTTQKVPKEMKHPVKLIPTTNLITTTS
jgi:hypothetical protein